MEGLHKYDNKILPGHANHHGLESCGHKQYRFLISSFSRYRNCYTKIGLRYDEAN